MIVLSGNNESYNVTSGLVTANCELKSNQREAGTRLGYGKLRIKEQPERSRYKAWLRQTAN